MAELNRARFNKLIALAESDHDGEALSAVRRAAGMILGQTAQFVALEVKTAAGRVSPINSVSLTSWSGVAGILLLSVLPMRRSESFKNYFDMNDSLNETTFSPQVSCLGLMKGIVFELENTR